MMSSSRFPIHHDSMRAVRLIAALVLWLSPVALARADDPGTWLRVLELPVFSGPVAAVHITITDVTDPQLPRLTGFERWELNDHNLPVRASTYYAYSTRGQEPAESRWTWSEDLLPESLWRITPEGITATEFVRLDTNVFEEHVTTWYDQLVRRHEVFPAERRVVTTSVEFNMPYRMITTFGPDWLTFQRLAEGDLGDGSESYWHPVSEVEFDSSSVPLRVDNDAGWEEWTVTERDGFGNPLEAAYVHHSKPDIARYHLTWRYTYREAATP